MRQFTIFFFFACIVLVGSMFGKSIWAALYSINTLHLGVVDGPKYLQTFFTPNNDVIFIQTPYNRTLMLYAKCGSELNTSTVYEELNPVIPPSPWIKVKK